MATLRGNPYYPYLDKPSKETKVGRFEFKPSFGVQLALVDKEQIKKAEGMGIEVKDPTESIPHKYVKFTSNVTEKEHLEYTPVGRKPVIYDRKGDAITKRDVCYMAPESDISVIFEVKEYDGFNKPIVRAIQLFEHVLPKGWDENDGGGNVVVTADLDEDLVREDTSESADPLNDSLDDI